MFNATNARTAVASAIEADSDLFAAELEDRFKSMPLSEQQALMRKLREVVSDPNSAAEFAAGNYSQNGQAQQTPPPALGAGTASPTEDETKKALGLVLNSTHVDVGFKHLLRRGFDQAAPDHIKVESDGTPTEIKGLQKQVKDLTKERDDGKDKLDKERDPAETGSLAHQLAAAQAGGSLDALKQDVKSHAEAAKTALDQASDTLGGGKKLGKPSFDTASQAVDEVINLVS